MADAVKQHTRAGSRHPIEAHEIPYLETLGERLASLRRDQCLTQVALAQMAELSTSSIARIEAGTRRTRRSTLDRIATALGHPELADELERVAGPAIAPESPYAERITRRRERRHGRTRAREEWTRRQARHQEVSEMLRELERLNREMGGYPEYEKYSEYD